MILARLCFFKEGFDFVEETAQFWPDGLPAKTKFKLQPWGVLVGYFEFLAAYSGR